MAGLVIDPIVCGRPAPSLDRAQLVDVTGAPLADVGLAPRLMAVGAVAQARREADGLPVDHELLVRAAELFAHAELDGESPAEYERRVALGAGLPRVTTRNATADIVRAVTSVSQVLAADLPATRLGDGYETAWVPAGRLFAAVMASNHPAPNDSWLHALAVGYSVVVRPGTRDPFTARRLVLALLAAGLAPHRISFLPSDHAVGEYLLDVADRGIVYGGDEAVEKWRRSGSVTTRGPGRSRALVDVELSDEVLNHLAASATFDGGTRCNNISLVLTTQDHRQVADGLAARFDKISSSPVTAPDSVLPVVDAARAKALARQLTELRGELTVHTGGGPALTQLADGSYRPVPTVLSTADARHPAVGLELPFPFVVVAPWRRQDDLDLLRDTLVLNVLTGDDELVHQAVADPTIRKVTRGPTLPWDAVPGIPHEGSLSLFLLRPKGIVSTGVCGRGMA